MDFPQDRRSNTLGLIGVACLVITWVVWLVLMLVPKSIRVLGPVFDALGPFQWLVLLAMFVLPMIAAKRGSRWWLAVAAAGAITFAYLFILDLR